MTADNNTPAMAAGGDNKKAVRMRKRVEELLRSRPPTVEATDTLRRRDIPGAGADRDDDEDVDVAMALLALEARGDMGEPSADLDLDALSEADKRMLLAMLRKRLGIKPDAATVAAGKDAPKP